MASDSNALISRSYFAVFAIASADRLEKDARVPVGNPHKPFSEPPAETSFGAVTYHFVTWFGETVQPLSKHCLPHSLTSY
jgi:hypothetical protein